MKRNLLLGIVCLLLLLYGGNTIYAAEIRVEGEACICHNTPPAPAGQPETDAGVQLYPNWNATYPVLSGGVAAKIEADTAGMPAGGYYLRYRVEAPVAGAYCFDAIISHIDSSFLSPYTVTVNGTPCSLQAGDTPFETGLAFLDNVLGNYTAEVLLQQGENEIEFRVNTSRPAGGAPDLYFYLDYFSLTPVAADAASNLPVGSVFMQDVYLRAGERAAPAPVALNAANQRMDAAQCNFTYESENNAVAMVENGMLTAKEAGVTELTVYCKPQNSGKEVLCKAMVYVAPKAAALALGEVQGTSDSGMVYATARVQNLTEQEQPYMLLLAAYEGNALIQAEAVYGTAAGQAAQQVEIALEQAAPEVVLYLWTGDGQNTPCGKKQIPAEEQVVPEPGAIHIEAEQAYSMVSEGVARINDAGLSGTAMLSVFDTAYQLGRRYEIVFEVDCAAAGIYELQAASTTPNKPWTSNYSVQINENAPQYAGDARFVGALSYDYGGAMAKYSFGTYMLRQGCNTIRFVVDEKNWSGKNCVFYLDYFALVPQAALPLQIETQQAQMGIYQADCAVGIAVAASGAAQEYTYQVQDYKGNTVRCGAFAALPGALYAGADLGHMDTGWYAVTVSDGTEQVQKHIAVVPPLAERAGIQSPIALDNASAWLANSYGEVRGYANAARLAGVGWVRERTRWAEIEPEKNTYDVTALRSVTDLIQEAGLQVLGMFSDAPDWAKAGGSLPADPMDVYRLMKTLGDETEIQAWEFWNEEEAEAFAVETPDRYAALFKAAAIGMSDSRSNPVKAFGGFESNAADKPFADLFFQNGAMQYSDVYNYHTHITDNGAENQEPSYHQMRENIRTSLLYDTAQKPIWITESGVKLPVSDAPDTRQQQLQAGYVVKSAAQSLAMGTGKHFYFILPYYLEYGGEFGLFDANKEVYPAYASLAVLTKMLGEGDYTGALAGMPAGVKGQVFHNGTADIAVVWAEQCVEWTLPAAEPDAVYDIMGVRKAMEAAVPIGAEPIYMVFENGIPDALLDSAAYAEKQLVKAEFSPAERIVLMQAPEEPNYALSKNYGYELDRDGENIMCVQVYNFNNVPVQGQIRASAAGPIEFEAAEQTVSIPAMSSAEVVFKIRAMAETCSDVLYDLQFEGVFDGAVTSPSVSCVYFNFEDGKQPDGKFTNSEKSYYYSRNSHSAVKAVSITGSAAETGGEITVAAEFDGTDNWIYPQLNLTDADQAAIVDADGILFSVYAEEAIADQAHNSINVFLYTTDGNKYYVGDGVIPIRAGWNTYGFQWPRFIQHGGEPVALDPANIKAVSVGLNTTRPEITYKIKNFGWFKAEPVPPLPEIDIRGIVDGGSYTVQELENAQITLPEGIAPERSRALLNGREAVCSIEGNCLNVDFSSCIAGRYTLTVVAYTQAGRAVDNTVTVYVQ